MTRSTAILALVLSAACAGEKAPAADSTVPVAAAPAPAAPAAMVMISSPAEGDSTGSDVTVVLGQHGVKIEKADSKKVEGIAHYHLFLDTIPTLDGEIIPPATKNIVHIGTGDSTYTFKGLAPGAHEIIAVLGYGDHSAMPQQRDTVRFVVKK
jgi:opacity protein-like surface antigen